MQLLFWILNLSSCIVYDACKLNSTWKGCHNSIAETAGVFTPMGISVYVQDVYHISHVGYRRIVHVFISKIDHSHSCKCFEHTFFFIELICVWYQSLRVTRDNPRGLSYIYFQTILFTRVAMNIFILGSKTVHRL